MKTNNLVQAINVVVRNANGFALAAGAIALGAILVGASGCATSNTAAARNAQGVERFTSGQYDDAIALFQASLDENPDSAETYYNLGSAYQRKAAQTGDQKLLEQAEDAYWTALDLNPAPETIVCCYRGLATAATSRGDAKGALATLEEWRDRNPQSIEPKLEIAYLLEAQERDADAYKLLKEIAEEAPGDYRAYYKMGVLAERAGDLADARENANLAVKLNPNDSNVVQRANLLEAQYEAKRRENELKAQMASKEIDDAQSQDSNAATVTESVVADAGSQTTRVPSTAAQAEQDFNVESSTEIILPEEEPAPVENSQPATLAPTNNGASNAPRATKLGFSEVATVERQTSPNGSQTNGVRAVSAVLPKRDDSDVKWITTPTAELARKKNAQLNGEPKPIPSMSNAKTSAPNGFANPNADGEGAVKPVFVSKLEPETATPNQIANTTAATQAPTSATTEDKPKADAVIKPADAEPKRKPTELFSGPPNLRAGSFF